MQTINISLNHAITGRLKDAIRHRGYNNISEYIRDLLRRDLNLEYHDDYHYDSEFLHELAREAKEDINKGRTKPLRTMNDLLT